MIVRSVQVFQTLDLSKGNINGAFLVDAITKPLLTLNSMPTSCRRCVRRSECT